MSDEQTPFVAEQIAAIERSVRQLRELSKSDGPIGPDEFDTRTAGLSLDNLFGLDDRLTERIVKRSMYNALKEVAEFVSASQARRSVAEFSAAEILGIVNAIARRHRVAEPYVVKNGGE